MKRLLLLTLFALAPVAMLSGCTDSGDDSSGGAEGEGEGEGELDFPAGNFEIYTVEVDDQCYDGAFEVLFMPDGPEHPKKFQYPIELPDPSTLPKTYTIQLQDPFHEMEITLERSGERSMHCEDALNPAVLLDEDTYGDCTADLTIDFDVQIEDRDHVSATANVSMSNFTSQADDRCPDVQDGCTIKLTLQGTRIQ